MNKILFSPCPECRKNGHDRQGDNLANYPDGSVYCFRCGYYKYSNTVTLIKAPLTLPKITLPTDCNTSYPSSILDWVQSFQLSKTDLLHNGALWSDSLDRLIFPFWIDGEHNNCSQCRFRNQPCYCMFATCSRCRFRYDEAQLQASGAA